MKLIELSTDSFGVLGTRTMAFSGESAVLFGRNEAGKTTCVDAFLGALFGLETRQSTLVGKRNVARYGEGTGRLSARLTDSEGVVVETSDTSPQGERLIAEDLFRDILVVKGGECIIRPGNTQGFMSAFVQHVLGGGAVSLDQVRQALQRPNSTRSTIWKRKERGLVAQQEELEHKILEADALREAQQAKEELRRERQALQGQRESLQREIANIDMAQTMKARQELQGQLRGLEVKHRELAEYRLAGAIDSDGIERLIKAAQAARHSHEAATAHLKQTLEDLQRFGREIQEAETELQQLLPEALQAQLRVALRDFDAADAAHAVAAPERGASLQVGFAGAIALVCAAGVFLQVRELWMAVVAGAVGGVVGWFAWQALGRGARGGTATVLEDRRRVLRVLCEQIGWTGASPADVSTRLADIETTYGDILTRLRTAEAGHKAARERSDEQEAHVRALAEQSDTAARTLRAAFQSWNVSSEVAFRDNLAKVVEAEASIALLAQALCARLGVTDGSLAALQVAFEHQAREEPTAADGAVAALMARSAPELAEQLATLRRTEADVDKRFGTVEQHYHEAANQVSHLEGALGADLDETIRDCEVTSKALRDLRHWKDAAALALEVVDELFSDVEGHMRTVIETASPIFASITGGRYGALKVQGANPFDPESITVHHVDKGAQPLEWVSTGAQDALWLSLRIALAKQTLEHGGLLLLDEPFLTLDAGRARAALEAMLSQDGLAGWQLLILTKDEAVANLCTAYGLPLVDIAGGEGEVDEGSRSYEGSAFIPSDSDR
jgi:uncharacterized protein YhaN